ncbi:MarR family transcriptional regulator [Thioclava sp. GXIMD2076]|uniref:MarR family transcriptional regulator n=1 Tax=Thioclava kandeliae TaxID=3070818 RepID=A0ABV1SFB3_9RHOB
MSQEQSFDMQSWDDLGRIIPAVGQSWRRVLGQRLANEGLSDATALPMLVLWRPGKDAMRQNELAQLLGLETSGVVRLLDRLSARGLLRRIEDPSDRRAKLLELTEEGAELAARANRVARVLRRELLDQFAPDDLEAAYRVLAQLSETLDDYEAKQKGRS